MLNLQLLMKAVILNYGFKILVIIMIEHQLLILIKLGNHYYDMSGRVRRLVMTVAATLLQQKGPCQPACWRRAFKPANRDWVLVTLPARPGEFRCLGRPPTYAR